MATEPNSPKTFDRLNDKIDAAEYAKILYDENAIEEYFRNKKVSSKELEQIKRYSAILGNAIMKGDGSIKYTIDNNGIKGFTNTLGYNNVDSSGNIHDKLWGYAVGYATSKLNDMNTYQEPAKTPDSTKLKYSNNALGTLFTRALFNKDGNLTTQNIKDFQDLDTLSENTRGLSERVKKSTTALDWIRQNYLSQLDENWTDEQKKELETNLNNFYTLFSNDKSLTDNEFLDFGKYSGLDTNVWRKLYATDFSTNEEESPEEKISIPLTIKDKQRWIRDKYRPYTDKLLQGIPAYASLNDDVTPGTNTETLINNAIKSSNVDDLLSFILQLLSSTDISATDFMRKHFSNNGNVMQFVGKDNKTEISKGYWINRILNVLKDLPNSPLIPFETNKYYISGIDTNHNTGLVWDTAGNNGKGSIDEYSIHRIPYWQNRIESEWNDYIADKNYEGDIDDEISQIYTHKNGGILKASTGAVMTRPDDWINTENTVENARDFSKWGEYFKIEDIIKDILEKNPSILTQIENGHDTPLILEIADKLDKIAKKNNLTFDPKNGLRGYNEWNKVFNQEIGLNKYFGNEASSYDILGPSTYNRQLLLKRLVSMAKGDSPEQKKESPEQKAANEIMKQNIDELAAEIEKETPEQIKDYDAMINAGLGRDTSGMTRIKPDSFVGGNNPPDKGNGINWNKIGQYASDFIPYGTNIAMFFDSLRTNRKVEDLQRRTAHLDMMKNYQHSITGDFPTRQEGYRNAAQTNYIGSRMAANTADADKGASYMLEANKQANDQIWKGFLADNAEIKRNQSIAEQMAIKTMENHIDIANKNALAINETNTFNRLNTAQRLQHDQQSRANLGRSMLDLYWYNKQLRENKERERNAFELELANQDAITLETQANARFNQSYYDWLDYKDASGNQPNKGKTQTQWLNTPEGKMAQSWLDETNRINNARRNVIYGKIYNRNYSDPYKGTYKIDYTRNYNTQVAKKGAKLIPRKR